MSRQPSDINVLVVEDEVLIAQDIKKHLLRQGYNVVGVVYNSDKDLDVLHNRNVNFTILDINIPGTRDGIDLAELINDKYQIPFIYLTSYSDQSTLEKARTTFPYGYIVKPFDERDLLSSIEIAIFKHESEQEKFLPELTLLNKTLAVNMSEREYEIVSLLVNGETMNEIANHHFLSENTIKSHVRRIYTRLDVHNRVELTRSVIGIQEMKK